MKYPENVEKLLLFDAAPISFQKSYSIELFHKECASPYEKSIPCRGFVHTYIYKLGGGEHTCKSLGLVSRFGPFNRNTEVKTALEIETENSPRQAFEFLSLIRLKTFFLSNGLEFSLLNEYLIGVNLFAAFSFFLFIILNVSNIYKF